MVFFGEALDRGHHVSEDVGEVLELADEFSALEFVVGGGDEISDVGFFELFRGFDDGVELREVLECLPAFLVAPRHDFHGGGNPEERNKLLDRQREERERERLGRDRGRK